jgi:protocatechuate 3,4-dioxygenase beta subunit
MSRRHHGLAAVVGSLLVSLAIPARAATQVFTVPGGTVPQAPQRDGQQPARPGTATLRGRVFAADSGQPLRKAHVRITSNGPGVTGQLPENRLATTDASGAYEFTELRAGRYNLNAQKGSFIGLSYGQQRPFEPGRPLEILDGQTIEKVDFSLPRGGVITGRILDEFNEPISDVQVSAMRAQNAGGTRRLMQAGRAGMTNDPPLPFSPATDGRRRPDSHRPHAIAAAYADCPRDRDRRRFAGPSPAGGRSSGTADVGWWSVLLCAGTDPAGRVVRHQRPDARRLHITGPGTTAIARNGPGVRIGGSHRPRRRRDRRAHRRHEGLDNLGPHHDHVGRSAVA